MQFGLGSSSGLSHIKEGKPVSHWRLLRLGGAFFPAFTQNSYYFTSAFFLNYENNTILKPVQTDGPFRREVNDCVELALQGGRPLSHINILAVRRHRRDKLGLSPGLGFL